MSADDKRPGKETKFIPNADPIAGKARAGDLDNIATEFITASDDRLVAQIVIIAGPGSGQSRPVYAGTNSIGRDPSQNRVGLDLGDAAISRKGHAILVCDGKTGGFRIYDGGKPNPVLLNGAILTGDQSMAINDVIQIGDTQLRLVKA